MRIQGFWWLFLGAGGVLASDPVIPDGIHGRIEVVAVDGHLSSVESRWDPRPGWSGRWWWDENGGSAWLGIEGFQVGPLQPAASLEGEREWVCGTDLAPGRWGAAADLGPAGFWAVQKPGFLEAGLQGRVSPGHWTIAAGADRTWSLSLPVPDQGPAADRLRAGLRVDEPAWSAGAEGVVSRDDRGTGWAVRARGAFEAGLWKADVRTRSVTLPGEDRARWEARVRGEAGPALVEWSRTAKDPRGRGTAGWESGPGSITASWGPDRGTKADASVGGGLAGLEWVIQAGASRDRYWTVSGGGSVSAREGVNRWKLSGRIVPGPEVLRQSWEAEGRTGDFSCGVRWRTEGFRLGWLGPQTDLNVTLGWEF